jgi:hypothetical protein
VDDGNHEVALENGCMFKVVTSEIEDHINVAVSIHAKRESNFVSLH